MTGLSAFGFRLWASPGARAIVAVLIAALPICLDAQGLTGAAQLGRAYDAIFDADFDEASARLREACGPGKAPGEACQLLDVVSRWWQIQLDPDDTSRDVEFSSRADAAIAAVDAWTRREPARAEAWFYLGGAYGARAQWRVLRGERLAAARDGKRIKEALEQALRLDSRLVDAYFGIGLYHYYAGVAPAAFRLLRFLLLLPGGNQVEGMREMQRARTTGQLLRDEADYQLHVIYLWYEKQTPRALGLLQDLRNRHPRNPHFLQLTAEIEDTYQHDVTASLHSWEALLEAARARRVNDADAAEARAHLGIALQLDRLFESDRAVEHLRSLIAARPTRPAGIAGLAQVRLAQALDRLGARDEAVAAYRAAQAAIAPGDPSRVGEQVRAGLRTAPDARTAAAYRLSLAGWRAFERRAYAEAARAFTESLALRPDDAVTRYRQARLLMVEGDSDGAMIHYDAILANRAATPPTFYAAACVEVAQVYEQRSEPGRAIEIYRIARDVFGADRTTKDAADRALARLAAR